MKMSSQDRWCTKADILKDLIEVNGRLGDVDEKYIVTGRKPPPMGNMDEDDEEINLRFGHHLNETDNIIPGPDLRGISEMLRLVDDYNHQDDDVDDASLNKGNQIVISKLDPDVPEFVPKGTSPGTVSKPSVTSPNNKAIKNRDDEIVNNSNYRTMKPNLVSKNIDLVRENESNGSNKCNHIPNGVNDEEVHKDDADLKNDTIDSKTNGFRIDKRIDLSEMNDDEIEDLTKKLRSKISATSKSSTSKREKNVAIATILKLYSAIPRQSEFLKTKNGDNNNSEAPIKLFTPEYFEKHTASTSLGDNKVKCEVHGVVVDIGPDRCPSNVNGFNATAKPSNISKSANKSLNISKNSLDSTETINSKHSKVLRTKCETDHKEKAYSPKIDVENPIKNKIDSRETLNSIEKVNKWLEPKSAKSPKPKPSVCLGPISFKRKTPVSRSPTSDADNSSRSTPNNIPHQITQFKPSKYADDLTKKFMEQGKALEKRQLDLWQRAEHTMKEKEELMKRKLLERASSSQGSSDDICSDI